ncbi:putative cilia-and flagella-associated protein [Plasmopara halstedii]
MSTCRDVSIYGTHVSRMRKSNLSRFYTREESISSKLFFFSCSKLLAIFVAMETKDYKDDKAEDKRHIRAFSEAKSYAGHEKASAKDDDESSAEIPESDLVDKVITYFFENDDFAHSFETFAERHCHVFDLNSDEMKLEYTDIYNKFLALFETKLEAYIQSQGATVQEFYNLVRHAYKVDRESGTVLCSEILVATADFDVFVQMMRQTKETSLLRKR